MADALCGGEFERERVCGKDNERGREGERERESHVGGIQKDKR